MPTCLALAGYLAACGVEGDLESTDPNLEDVAGSALDSENGVSVNGLSANGLSTNGLSGNGLSANGLSNNGLSANGLSANGLTTAAFAAWFHSGDNSVSSRAYAAQLMKYVVRCACPAGELRSFNDGSITYTWIGSLGLAPTWCGAGGGGRAILVAEQEWVSACLLAHVNVLANPAAPDPNLSVPISLRTSSPERSLPVSVEEQWTMTDRDGIFFGNMFDGGPAKGLYAGPAFGLETGLTQVRDKYDAGRGCWMNGCAGNQSGIQFLGEGYTWLYSLRRLLETQGYSYDIRCRKDADCASKNGGLTPVCDLSSLHPTCRPLSSRCTTPPNHLFGPPLSCLDPAGRTWMRAIHVTTGKAIQAEKGKLAGNASAVTACGTNCVAASLGGYVANMSGGSTTSELARRFADGVISDSYKIRVRYRGNGTLGVELLAHYTSTVLGQTNALPTASLGIKALTCPLGRWCWAEWTQVALGHAPLADGATSGSDASTIVTYDARVFGSAGTAAPEVDMIELDPTR